jgi:acyl-CoA oxidase
VPKECSIVLKTLCQLYGLYNILEQAGSFLELGYYSVQHLDWIRSLANQLCKETRKYAVGLTDAFGFTDYVINSPLGRYDGQVYEAYFARVQKAHAPAQTPHYFDKIVSLFELSFLQISPLLNPPKEPEEAVLELEDEDEH